jgi:hypothetical protein
LRFEFIAEEAEEVVVEGGGDWMGGGVLWWYLWMLGLTSFMYRLK